MNDLITIEPEPLMPVAAAHQAEIADCNYLAEGVRTHMQKAWQMAVALGYRLSLIKAKCAHGEWVKLFGEGKWEQRSHFAFTKRAADKYIQLFTACEARARQLEQSEGMLELLGYTTGLLGENDGVVDIQAKSEELTTMLTGMAPYAENMSQALFSFMYPDEAQAPLPSAPDFFKGGRNTRGRLRKGRELSEQERLDKEKAANWAALEGALKQVQATLDAGLHLLLPQGCRGVAIHATQEILETLIHGHASR